MRLYKDPKSGLMVDLMKVENGSVEFSPQGGGFVRTMDEAAFFQRFTESELPAYMPAKFASEAVDFEIQGYSNQRRWNGWAMPHFEMSEARKLAEHFPDLRYDEAHDAFVYEPRDSDQEVFEAVTIRVHDRDLRVYPIGAGSWCWDQVEIEADRPQSPRS